MICVGIMQPYFFPYIGYWQLINAVDKFLIYDDVSYIKQGYINRNSFLVDGEAKRVTLELFGASSNKLINEIGVGGNGRKILKTIEQAYRKAPHFEEVMPLLESILGSEERNLARFLGLSIQTVTRYLGIETEMMYSSDIKTEDALKGQGKVIALCKHLDATCYINAIGGQKLYDKAAFEANGIELHFLETAPTEYPQFGKQFVPSLSIIDVMMFNSPRQIIQMLERYRLI
jgi:hypothetical protein